MGKTERKQRELAKRRDLILDEAETAFGEAGYLGLNLDALAERVEYSKATLYNHFASKEDLLAAIAVRRLEERANLFGRALLFEGRPRERMCCVGVADEIMQRNTPHIFSLMQMVRSHSLWEKASETTRERYERLAGTCYRAVMEVVGQARAAGDLPGEEADLPTARVVSGLIALSLGSYLLSQGNALYRFLFGEAAQTPADYLPEQYDAYLDGLGWRPLSTETDYAATRERARAYL